MVNPIKHQVGTVFIPVRDIEKAKAWYVEMLGLPDGEILFGHLFCPPMQGGPALVLDAMPKWRGENGELATYGVPAFTFLTEDVHAAYDFLKAKGVEFVTDVQFDQYFVFRDLDGNHLMIGTC